jgi:hypothetical protein
MSIPISAELPTTRPTTAQDWIWLLRLAAVTLALSAVLQQLAGRFFGPSLVVVAVVMTAGAVLARTSPRAVAATLGAVALLNLLLHAFMFAILVEGVGMGVVYSLNLLDVLASVLLLAASIPVFRRRHSQGSATPGRSAAAAGVVWVLATALTVSLYLTRDTVEPVTGEPVLTSTGLRVDTDRLVVEADPTGTGSFIFRNDDPLYPRSFDVDALDLHVVVAPRTSARIELPEGEHEFHDFVTMTDATSGTVVVR